MAHMPKVLSLIAEHGITFDNSFVNFSLCAPSRSSLLTGQAAHNDGVVANQAVKGGGWESFKNDEANTLPVWLKSAGYTTALVGKYVNGYGKGKVPRESWASALGKWMDLGGTDASNHGSANLRPARLGPLVRLRQGALLRLLDQRERQGARLRPCAGRLLDRRARRSGGALHQGPERSDRSLLHADCDQSPAWAGRRGGKRSRRPGPEIPERLRRRRAAGQLRVRRAEA